MSINDVTNQQIPWWDIRNKVVTNKKKRTTESKSWSSYWMDDDSYDYFYDKNKKMARVSFKGKKNKPVNVEHAAKLAAVRRAVSNFVQILTNDDTLKVVFSGGEQSYTTGKVIVISAEIKPEKFDTLVGTALHEAAHCVFSGPLFEQMKKLDNSYVSKDKYDWLKEIGVNFSLVRYHYSEHFNNIHLISNFLEDRRIDTEVFVRSPGYRPYYQAMYDTYWNAKDIAKALIYDMSLRQPTLNSYLFRLINLTNPATKHTLHHLDGMKKIYDTVDLDNIRRFSDIKGVVKSKSFYRTCANIYNIILEHVSQQNVPVETQPINISDVVTKNNDEVENNLPNLPNLDFDGHGFSIESDDIGSDVNVSKDNDDDLEDTSTNKGDDLTDETGINTVKDDSDDDTLDVTSPLPDDEIEKEVAKEFDKKSLGNKEPNVDNLKKEIENFINGDIKKKSITKSMNSVVNAIEESGTTVSTVSILDDVYSFVRVVKLNNSVTELIKPLISENIYYTQKQSDLIKRGKRLGQIITDRIKIRHDNNETKFTRRNLGKIDRRLIHSLGTENENIFFNKIVDSYKNSIFYITIDCSYSMSSNCKWDNSVILATGLTYAATKINNFDVVVNLRYDYNNIWSVTLFDSRINSFSHYEKWMKKFKHEGGTPESIVYAVEKNFIESLKTSDNNVYFITFTDGEPYLSNDIFFHHHAITHCKNILNEFRNFNINILAYFLEDSKERNHIIKQEVFKKSYGNDGVFVSLENFSMISKSINTLLTKV